MGTLWDRLRSWFRPEEKYSIEPWEGGPIFDSELPEADVSGIEVLNDDVTPMEYVVAVLMQCLGLSRRDATESMLRVHFKGVARFGRMRTSLAEELADHIRTEVAKTEYPLTCRVCEGQATPAPEPLTRDDVIKKRGTGKLNQ